MVSHKVKGTIGLILSVCGYIYYTIWILISPLID